MLNAAKLFKEFQKLNHIFSNNNNELDLAKKIWNEICNDNDFAEKIKNINSQINIPHWIENLPSKIQVTPKKDYCVIAVDGSQIYPDRHQGTLLSLINIGSIILNYCSSENEVKFDSTPYIINEHEIDCVEEIDCKREELEFLTGFDLLSELRESEKKIFLFDGSLIFWHLESKNKKIKEEYLNKYLAILYKFYKNDLLIAGYISMPKSKELVNLLRIKFCDFELIKFNDKSFENILDTSVSNFFLDHDQRTILFKNNSNIVSMYPNYLNPYFFYMNLGEEIVRIEIPEYIAKNDEKVLMISQIILDQCKKGFGYPVCLAEAHEQAVVKSHDRELFYKIIQNLNKNIVVSQKSLKKRKIGI